MDCFPCWLVKTTVIFELVMFEQLHNHIRRYTSLSANDEELLAAALVHRKVRKKEFLFEQGQTCNANYFILNGCLRMFTNTDQGTEQVIQFAIDQWWITDYTSLDLNKPTVFNLQAVEDSNLALLPKANQDELFTQVPQLERYFRIILQRAFAAYVMRIHYIFTESGEERYRHFSNAFPDFVQRVPQYMLASYLGFTPEFLSKIRGKKQ